MTSDEINFFWKGGCTFFEHKKNEEILEKFKLEPVDKKLRNYISNNMPKKCWTIDQMDKDDFFYLTRVN